MFLLINGEVYESKVRFVRAANSGMLLKFKYYMMIILCI